MVVIQISDKYATFAPLRDIDDLSLQNPQYGSVAEWLGRGLQNLLQQFESAPNLQQILIPHLAGFYFAFS